MFKASQLVKEYIEERMSECKGWGDIKVIFSDSSVPGEGVAFIKKQLSSYKIQKKKKKSHKKNAKKKGTQITRISQNRKNTVKGET